MAKDADYKEVHERIKKNIRNSYDYFYDAYKRFHEMRRFVFQSNLTNDDINLLNELDKPTIEANELDAKVSRLCGEFSEQEPSIEVMRGDESEEVDEELINFCQGHIRYILDDANSEGFSYETFRNQLSGGFSVMKVFTEYASELSFNQVIKVGIPRDPTLCFFDPLAKKTCKTDGRFSGEGFPMTEAEFKERWPKIDISNVTFSKISENGFNWSYKNLNEKILMVVNYFEYKKKRVKIVKLANNHVMTEERYKKLLTEWEEMGFIHQPPAIVGKPRWTDLNMVVRYIAIEDQIIEKTETDFKYLPYIWVDGNSALIKESDGGGITQLTRPYVYNAVGLQKMKNFALQTWANEIENMTMSKWLVPLQGIPQDEESIKNWTAPQKPSVLTYNAFKDDNPESPIPPPMPVQRVGTPPEVMNGFTMTTNAIQATLGSYDSQEGVQDGDLSGVAIMRGAIQSNSASKPFIVGYIYSLNTLGKIILDLIPKYQLTPRTVPIINAEGKHDYIKINQEGGVSTQYSENALNIKVRAGVNFEIQKERDLRMIFQGMSASPAFAQFINQKCLPTIIKNMRLEGGDVLVKQAEEFMKQMEQMAKQQQNQPNPLQMKAQLERQKLIQDAREAEMTAQLKSAQIAVEKQEADTDQLKALAAMGEAKDQVMIAHMKAHAEETRAAADMAMKEADMHHRHRKENMELQHKLEGEKDHGKTDNSKTEKVA